MRRLLAFVMVALLVLVALASFAAPKVSITRLRGLYDEPHVLGFSATTIGISNAGPFGPITISGWRNDATLGWIAAEMNTDNANYTAGDSVITVFAGQSMLVQYRGGVDLLYVKTLGGFSSPDSNEAAYAITAE